MQLVKRLDFSLFAVRKILEFLDERIATRIKRAIFVFSVMAAIDRIHGMDDETIEQVNSQLKLARKSQLCKEAAKTRDAVWSEAAHGKDVVNDFPALSVSTSHIERDMITRYYVRNCPDWLRYGDASGSDMRLDLNKLFRAMVTRDVD